MQKLILFVKRKPGLTHEQFREHYESTHAPLAWRVLQPHLIRYTRNFIAATPDQMDPPYDCVTEFWFKDRQAMEASIAFALSEEGQVLARDEENFMDRPQMLSYAVDEAHSHS